MVNEASLAWQVQWDAANKVLTEDVYVEEEKDSKCRKKTINNAVPNRCSISFW